LLQFAASVERASEHPLAAAIMDAASAGNIALLPMSDFKASSGKGASAAIDNRRIVLGTAKFLGEAGIVTDVVQPQAERLRGDGASVIFVGAGETLAGLLAVADPIKKTTPAAIRALEAQNIAILMLTGDNGTTAQAVARKLRITDVKAEILPADKNATVESLRRAGRVVAMAGDGINDAPALAAADVGIAMGTGADVAMASAGMTLIRGDLAGVVRARKLSAATMQNIRQNLLFAFLYNVLGVPIAAGALYPLFGVTLSPAFSAAAMALSSVSVVANALRLRTIAL
jgi:Cu+-exporting ATPase